MIFVATCPHCGGESALREGHDNGGHNASISWLQIHCTKCPAAMRVSEYECNSRDGRMLRAVELWNRRLG